MRTTSVLAVGAVEEGTDTCELSTASFSRELNGMSCGDSGVMACRFRCSAGHIPDLRTTVRLNAQVRLLTSPGRVGSRWTDPPHCRCRGPIRGA
jgi:hypothetical protein